MIDMDCGQIRFWKRGCYRVEEYRGIEAAAVGHVEIAGDPKPG